MYILLKKVRSSEYFKNFAVLSSGTIVSQMVPMIFYPIVSRLFNPADFGLLSSLTTVTNLLVIIIALGYQHSILLTKNRSEAINVVFTVLALSILMSLFCFVVVSVFLNDISFYSNNILLRRYYWLSFLSAFAIIIYKLYNEWSVKFKDFKRLSFNKMINSSSVSLSETMFGFTGIGGVGLIFGDLLGRIISASSCVYSFFKNEKNVLRYVSIDRVKPLLKKYIDCLIYIMPSGLINNLGRSLPIFFIGTYFSQHELGLYAMANMVIAVPASIISFAMRDVFRQRAREKYEKTGSCRSILLKTTKYLSVLSLMGFLVLFFIAPDLFELVLGHKWMEAGIYARYLIPMVAISFVTEVVAGVFIIVQKMKWELYWQLTYLCTVFIALYVSVRTEDIYVVLLAVSISKSLTFLLNIYMSYRFSKDI